MTNQEYQIKAYSFVNKRLSEREMLTNSALGMAGESGEILSLVGYSSDESFFKDKLTEEIGDLFWYGSMMLTLIEEDLESTLRGNYYFPISDKNNILLGITLCTVIESLALADLLKKHLFQDHPINKEKIKYKISEVLLCSIKLLELIEVDLESVLQGNINKLSSRYPNGFSKEKSINRKV